MIWSHTLGHKWAKFGFAYIDYWRWVWHKSTTTPFEKVEKECLEDSNKDVKFGYVKPSIYESRMKGK